LSTLEMFSEISLPVPSQQMTMFLMDADSPQVAGGRLATGGGNGYWDLGGCGFHR
jgi:hypothetical protein